MDNNLNNNSGNNGNNDRNNNNNNPKRQNIFLLLIAALITMLCMTYFMRTMTQSDSQEITYNEFIEMLEDGKVSEIVIESDRIAITPAEQKKETGSTSVTGVTGNYSASSRITYYTGIAESYETLTNRVLDYNSKLDEDQAQISISSEIPDNSGVIMSLILYYVLPIALIWVLLSFLSRRISKNMGPLGMSRSNAKVYVQKETGVTFKDVAGEDEAKESLQEVVDFLHNPGKYAKIGAKLPKGALLVGPPGTGKTLLAKAVAGEAHVPFFSLAGSDFVEMYVGLGASRVRDLFKEANKNAPCIIFIDEIDAIGRSRSSRVGGNDEQEQTLNQLLSEMDGFDSSKGVLLLGATNRPEILDKALLRPGRFDRRIIVDKPDLKGREEILKVHAKDVKMDETVDLKGVALATSGAVGSDLANMINEAAINAVKAKREYVSQQDLMEAVEQVLVGKEKKDRILSKEERKLVSYHEVGHALVSAVQKNTEPVQKITIVPRTMGALGYVMQVPEDEKYLRTKNELHDDIVVALGGRAAEEVVFNTVTTGAENDIEKATATARAMVTMFGMSDKFGLMQLESVENRYLDGRRQLNCSDETATQIDQEVMKILSECYEEAKNIIESHLEAMDKLAKHLIEKETITGKEFMQIYREVENIPEPTEEEIKARSARIVAKRPEAAAIGEDIPTKDEIQKAEEAKQSDETETTEDKPEAEFTVSDSAYYDASDCYKKAEDSFAVSGRNFDAEVSDETVKLNTEAKEETPVTGGGRFSHVADDFDKKN